LSIFEDCPQTENFKFYNGGEVDCQFHYVLTKYNNEQYIELRARCADLTRAFVINESCIDICETEPRNPDSECGQYLAGREIMDIILIQK